MDGLIGLLQQHRKGITHQEISDSLRDMVAAVTDAQKGGKIVITFGIEAILAGRARRSLEGDEIIESLRHANPVPKQ